VPIVTDIPVELAAARKTIASVFAAAHEANDNSGQGNEHLRQLVAQSSAALAAIDRAIIHADNAFKETPL
jgi:hypothetical protein